MAVLARLGNRTRDLDHVVHVLGLIHTSSSRAAGFPDDGRNDAPGFRQLSPPNQGVMVAAANATVTGAIVGPENR